MTSQPKPSLEEMASICQDEAEHRRGILAHYSEHYPDRGPDARREREAFVLDAAAEVFRILRTREDKSRKFIGELAKEYAGG